MTRAARLTAYTLVFGVGCALGVMLAVRPSTLPALHPSWQGMIGPSHGNLAMPPAASRAGPEARTPPLLSSAPSRGVVRPAAPPTRRSHDATPRRPATPVPARVQAGLKPAAQQAGTARQTTDAIGVPGSDAAGTGANQPSSIVVTPPQDAQRTAESQQTVWETPRFHVQAGTFTAEADADALVKRLQSLGYAATSSDGDVYRVWVGGYFDRETAERLAANLRAAGVNAELVP